MMASGSYSHNVSAIKIHSVNRVQITAPLLIHDMMNKKGDRSSSGDTQRYGVPSMKKKIGRSNRKFNQKLQATARVSHSTVRHFVRIN